MKLVIATKNLSKYQSIKNLIESSSQNLDLKISQISAKIPSAPENGKSSYANSLIKAKYYRDYVTSAYIVADDKILFLNTDDNSFANNFHRLGGKTDVGASKIFTYLQEILKRKNPIDMIRTRFFVLVINGGYYRFSSKFACKLYPLNEEELLELNSKKILENPLNYFAIPKRGTKRLCKYTQEEKSVFVYNKVVRKKLGILLKKINL